MGPKTAQIENNCEMHTITLVVKIERLMLAVSEEPKCKEHVGTPSPKLPVM